MHRNSWLICWAEQKMEEESENKEENKTIFDGKG